MTAPETERLTESSITLANGPREIGPLASRKAAPPRKNSSAAMTAPAIMVACWTCRVSIAKAYSTTSLRSRAFGPVFATVYKPQGPVCVGLTLLSRTRYGLTTAEEERSPMGDTEPQPSTPAGPNEGDRAPGFSLPADGGRTVSLSALKGHKVVLYFYPKDDTSG